MRHKLEDDENGPKTPPMGGDAATDSRPKGHQCKLMGFFFAGSHVVGGQFRRWYSEKKRN
jgi:hypothetical protein